MLSISPSASISGHSLNQGLYMNHGRRRSADLGGLSLATGNTGLGRGWLGCDENDTLQTRYAELLSEMYEQTLHAVHENNVDFTPADLPMETRSRLINSLDSWHFEPHKLPDEEVLSCVMLLFESLYHIKGMEDVVAISLKQVSSFVRHLRRIYRLENSYHNFEHAVDVLQATYTYLRSAGMVPSVSILLEDGNRLWESGKVWDSGALITSLDLVSLFTVYIAAIGHDVGHPGFSNGFMQNAKTPLSVVFDGKSALEQMHCQLLLQVMRYHGLGQLLDNPRHGWRARKLLLASVLATDMVVHNDFMKRLQLLTEGEHGPVCSRQAIACQALLKCADISNPSRPYPVAQHWAAALMEEWNSQANLEKHFSLPNSVPPSGGPVTLASSQVFFMSTFAKPLLDLMVMAVPEMSTYAKLCTSNLGLWKARLHQLQHNNSRESASLTVSSSHSPKSPEDFCNAFPLTLPTSYPIQCVDRIWTSFLPRSCPFSGSSRTSSSESGKRMHQEDALPSGPSSPSESVGSFLFSPESDSSSNHRPSSSCGSSASIQAPAIPLYISDGNAVIRAASKVAKRTRLFDNRNSWTASTTVVMR